MPVSSSVQISDCLDHIIRLQPESVLDIGCGFGLWGFLCREYLDVWNGRVAPEAWQVRIDGVELWEPYIQTHQRALYTQIHLGDVRALLPGLGQYDLVIAGDVIEHLDKAEGEEVIEQLYEKARRALLVNIPLAGDWDHPEYHGNPGELHRSQWSPGDFAPYAPAFRDYQLPCGQYGSFFCMKPIEPEKRLAGLLDAALRRESEGDLGGAVRALSEAFRLEPADTATALHLADLQLKRSNPAGAVDTLRRAVEASPGFHFGRLSLARILWAQGHAAAALAELQYLLADETLPRDLRSQAEALVAQRA